MLQALTNISDLGRRIRARQISPLDVVEHCLRNIARHEPQVSAWTHVDETSAREQAHQQEQRLLAGDQLGPLAGIPVGIKDIIDVEALPTTADFAPRQGLVAEQDAQVVRHLRAADAIILGKTVTTQFACFDPPTTRNPWNLERTPGGSSSGSAAAVALGMCVAALGTQTGGSIIRPASYCGVVGYKPTYDLLSMQGILPVSWHLDHVGPLARNVADVQTLLSCLQPAYEATTPPHASKTARTDSPPFTLARVVGFPKANASVENVFDHSIKALFSQFDFSGEVSLPTPFSRLQEAHRTIMAVEAAGVHQPHFVRRQSDFKPRLTELIQIGLNASAIEYAAALQLRHQFRLSMLASIPDNCFLVMPATTTMAPDTTTTGDPSFNSVWSLAGMPTVTVPCRVGTDQLPCGLQVIGPCGADSELLSVAQQVEKLIQPEDFVAPTGIHASR